MYTGSMNPKRTICCAILLLASAAPLLPFTDFAHGPRSLALGYASIAFTYDGSALYLNPAFLGVISTPLSGYQYGSSRRDFGNAADLMAELAGLRPAGFEALSASNQARAVELLRTIYAAPTLMAGGREKTPFFVGPGYGAAISNIRFASLTPVGSDVPGRDPAQIRDADIASLQLEYAGLDATRYTVSFGKPISSSTSAGVSIHYLRGRAARYRQALLDSPFAATAEPVDYLAAAWESAASKFSKLVIDAGLVFQVGKTFTLAFSGRNLNKPALQTGDDPIVLARRLVAGFALRPTASWGIFMDADIEAADIHSNGRLVQPVSLGIEKGLFKNTAFVRAGIHNDIKAKQLFGARANPLYCGGFGIHLSQFLGDMGLGIDSRGRVRDFSLSLSVFLK